MFDLHICYLIHLTNLLSSSVSFIFFSSGGSFLSYFISCGGFRSCGYLVLLFGMLMLIYGYEHHVEIVIIFNEGGGLWLHFCTYVVGLLEVIFIVASFGGCVVISLWHLISLYSRALSWFCIIFLMESVGYHILMPRKHYDFQDSHAFDDENLGRLFQVYSLDFSLDFRKVLGK